MRIHRAGRYDAATHINTFRTLGALKEETMRTMQFGLLALLAVVLVDSAPRPADAG